jgi:hypothetical protein
MSGLFQTSQLWQLVIELNNNTVRIKLGRFSTASNNSLMQRNQLLKHGEMLGILSLYSDL